MAARLLCSPYLLFLQFAPRPALASMADITIYNPDLPEGPDNQDPSPPATRRDALEVWEEDQGTRDHNQERGKGGRKKLEVDWNLVAKLCELFCTQEEVAGVLEISVDTLNRRIVEKYGAGFTWKELFQRLSVKPKVSLRRAQMKMATQGAGNVLMQIWLGKQYLNQRDTSAPPQDQGDDKRDKTEDTYGTTFVGAPGQEQLPVNSPPPLGAVRPSNASANPGPDTNPPAEATALE